MAGVMSSFRLDGRVAVVTGAGSGLGQGAAQALAEAGASLVLVGRTQATLDATRTAIIERGGDATTLVCDVTDAGAGHRLHRGAAAHRRAGQQRRHQHPAGLSRGRRGQSRPHPGPERPRRVPGGPGRGAPHGGERRRQHRQHLLADGPCRQPAPLGLLHEQARARGPHQGARGRAGAARRPGQLGGADLRRDADDPALLRRPRVPRRGAEPDPDRPAGQASRT